MQSSQALLHLIDDILDLSKIEAGKLELEHAPFYLPSLIHDAQAMFSDQARAKGLTLTAPIAAELNIVLLGDAHRLLQILTNLVGNAVKFTNEGRITIAVTCLEDRAGALRLRFTVTDTGIGIPSDKHSTIFEAFSQADSSTTRRYGGTGLGLSIARQLCHVMGGEIGLNSEPGKGSTFWFTVVLERQHTTAALPTRFTRTTATQGELLHTEGGLGASPARQELQGGSLPHRTLNNLHPAGRGQSGQSAGYQGPAGSDRLQRHCRAQWPRGRIRVPGHQVRPHPHGLPDAGDGRLRGDTQDPRA